MVYLAYYIQIEDDLERELFVHELSMLNALGLEELEYGVKVYLENNDSSAKQLEQKILEKNYFFERDELPEQNWNQLWESNFQPVYIEDAIQVRATFHQPKSGYLFDIVIDPKMSFGTGHHETTQMMMQSMLELDFNGKNVLDFGAGTGILSVLAEKLGAKKVLAIDHDPWCIESIEENKELNRCKAIEAYKSDSPLALETFDLILANINKSVLLENAEILTSMSKSEGLLILSGLLSTDYQEITSVYSNLWKEEKAIKSLNNWISIVYRSRIGE